jgi:hypothetical protein
MSFGFPTANYFSQTVTGTIAVNLVSVVAFPALP